MRSYCVYKHTNIVNNKCYIGITCRNPWDRWHRDGSGYRQDTQPKFYNAIQKYGWDKFEHEILFQELTLEQAVEKEKELISYYDSFVNGYNSSTGGEGNPGHVVTESMRKQMSESHKGQVPWSKGKKLSEEHRKKISESHIGKNTGVRSQQTKQSISDALKGKQKSEEARRHMSESAKGRIPWNKGKTGLKGHAISDEVKSSIAQANGKAVSMYDMQDVLLIM